MIPSHKKKTNKRSRAVIAVAAGGALAVVSGGIALASGAHDAPAAAHHHHFALGAQLPSGGKVNTLSSHTSIVSRLADLSPHKDGAPKSVPNSVDLSQYAIDPGNQGQVGSCVSWAIDYSGYSIQEKQQGISGGPQAPMYTYAQIAKGNDQGSTPDDTFSIAESQGVDSKSDYSQGDFDFTSQPTDAERQNAAHWKLSGHTKLHTGNQIQADVKQALADGEPVAISLPVHQSFQDVTQQQAADYSYQPGGSEDPVLGGHEITIVGYNDQGVRVENSWGANWGDGGYINLSWDFLASQVEEANAIGKLVK
ncbi:C1 family peptidase [Streptomyces natalensis]|uniref:Peptidase n=1 Tax=Streptomyces natalensis ATCC 27448 TaxID=1240678 RepID=A0A0D7CIK6_9ACTN|nr:C1 family peptidase [Streptomyces natalensis]KIZ16043.1 peptidase [Streptomyces natalensis ATCC 27448]